MVTRIIGTILRKKIKMESKFLKLSQTLIFLFIPFICISQLKFLPKSKGQLVEHTYYSLSYLEEHEQAEWVHYKLNDIMLKGIVPRKSSFKSDKLIITKSAALSDYKYSGYDRGHLVPAGDMKLSKVSMIESFLMSNISPQKKDFNGREWLRLEKHVRSLAKKNEIYVTTGGVLKPSLKKIGKEKNISVPELFYKIIYDAKNEKMFAYLMPNKKLESIEKYLVTVDSIEVLTGIDFYPQLIDELEEKMESTLNALPIK